MSKGQFEAAAAVVKTAFKEAGKNLSNDELLSLYGWFKQASVGDNNTDKPGMFSFEAKSKWEAWNKCKGKSQEEAQGEYIKVAKELLTKYGLQDKIQGFWFTINWVRLGLFWVFLKLTIIRGGKDIVYSIETKIRFFSIRPHSDNADIVEQKQLDK